jgi:hypothetical protein
MIVDSGAVLDLSGNDSRFIVGNQRVSFLGCSLDSHVFRMVQRIPDQKPEQGQFTLQST